MHAKMDRLDTIKLVLALRGWQRGEHDRMHVIKVPGMEAEAQRHLVWDRIRKLLRTVGCWGCYLIAAKSAAFGGLCLNHSG
jgi:transposase